MWETTVLWEAVLRSKIEDHDVLVKAHAVMRLEHRWFLKSRPCSWITGAGQQACIISYAPFVFLLLHHENKCEEIDNEQQSAIYWGCSEWESGAKDHPVNNSQLLKSLKVRSKTWFIIAKQEDSEVRWVLDSWHLSSSVLYASGLAPDHFGYMFLIVSLWVWERE